MLVEENMKYIAWKFRTLSVPMILGDDGVLFTTSKAVWAALGITKTALTHIYQGAPDRFSDIRVPQIHPKNEILAHRKEFGMERMRDNMRPRWEWP